MKKAIQSSLDNKSILKKIAPFILIFIFSLSIATNELFSLYSTRAKAADEGININLTNLSAPLTQYSKWKWQANVYATKHLGEQLDFNILVHWCDNSDSLNENNCSKKNNPQAYLAYYPNSKTALIDNETSFNFEHQSFPCGRINLEIQYNNIPISTGFYNTGIECNLNQEYHRLSYQENSLQGLNEKQQETNNSPGKLIDDIFSMFNFFKLPSSDNEDGADQNNEPPPRAPGSNACPIPGGQVTCGSLGDPINDCEHCGPGYVEKGGNMADCNDDWGTAQGLDIAGSGGTAIYLPEVAGEVIEWTMEDETSKNKGNIIRYSGISTVDKDNVWWIQFHHSAPGSGIGIGNTARSGEVGAKIYSGGDHIHVQIGGQGTKPGASGWLPASAFFCN